MRKKVADHTLPLESLPPGSRLMDAEDFMVGHIDAMPEELIKIKNERIVYDHPWPFNIQLDPIKNQERVYNYTIHNPFYTPQVDCQVLTNTIIEDDPLEAHPPIEPTQQHFESVLRQYEWSTGGDNVLVRLPRKREFPKINIKPTAKYGLTTERQEMNVLNSMFDFSQNLMTQYYHAEQNTETLKEILHRRFIAFPHCQVPFKRQDKKINMNLCIESMSLAESPLPLINQNPSSTKEREPAKMAARSWRSTLEQSNRYSPDWSFTLPRNSYLHTIQLAGRIKRDHREGELLARSVIHAFGLTCQVARLQSYGLHMTKSGQEVSNLGSYILQDPLKYAAELDDKDILEQPIVVQTIAFELPKGQFHFMRYQLNTTKFDDTNERRVKNQAWYSGPISDLTEALRYYLDFQAFNMRTSVNRPRLAANDQTVAQEAAVGQ